MAQARRADPGRACPARRHLAGLSQPHRAQPAAGRERALAQDQRRPRHRCRRTRRRSRAPAGGGPGRDRCRSGALSRFPARSRRRPRRQPSGLGRADRAAAWRLAGPEPGRHRAGRPAEPGSLPQRERASHAFGRHLDQFGRRNPQRGRRPRRRRPCTLPRYHRRRRSPALGHGARPAGLLRQRPAARPLGHEHGERRHLHLQERQLFSGTGGAGRDNR